MSSNFESFEEAFNKLKFITENFEGNEDLTLDELVKKYEDGINAYNFCVNKLEEAEKKIKIIDTKFDA